MEGRWQPDASLPCNVRTDRDPSDHEHRLGGHVGRRLPTFAMAE